MDAVCMARQPAHTARFKRREGWRGDYSGLLGFVLEGKPCSVIRQGKPFQSDTTRTF